MGINAPPDAYDAILQHLYRKTLGSMAALRRSSGQTQMGVCLRVAHGSFRVYPNTEYLEPFENAVRQLNPEVAVKVHNATVNAALARIGKDQKVLFIDKENRIQILPTIAAVAFADKGQGAAFIYDERMLVVWADEVEGIAEQVKDFQTRLLALVWKHRAIASDAAPVAAGMPGAAPVATALSTSARKASTDSKWAHKDPQYDFASSFPADFTRDGPAPPPLEPTQDRSAQHIPEPQTHALPPVADFGTGVVKRRAAMLPVEQQQLEVMPQFPRSRPRPLSSKFSSDASDSSGNEKADGQAHEHDNEKTSISDVVSVDGDGKVEGKLSADLGSLEDGAQGLPRRPMRFEAAIFMGIATGFSFLFVIIALDRMLDESMVDGTYIRWALAAVAPLLFCVSLFFTQALVNCVFYTFGPVSQFYTNSKYYSGIAPTSDFNVDKLPHVTIQMPVYKESLEATIMPSINSIQKAMISYARQGGTSSIFVNDDGMQLLSQELREERMRFYENRNIGWVARPPHGTNGFVRAGRFKKASNMNYGLTLALRMEELLEELDKDPARKAALGVDGSDPFMDEEGVLSDHALELAVNETNGEAWASGGKALRIGEVILLVDSDTQVPEDCLRDAARELAQTPEVAILQHGSDVLQVAHHYFENITAYFTRRVNQAIAMACANGEVAPFVGHNAFLRWRAMQEVAFVDSDGKRKIWSESNVSEDFDLSLRLQVAGYTIRWATYSKGGFKEGVSLTCDDEMNRWQKYAYGASELMFRPLVQWLRHGPFAAQFIKFMGSRVPLYYKMSLLAYYWSYFGIAGSFLISVLNYVLLGFTIRVDNYYLKGFELFLACLVLFFAAGNLAHAILEYRLKIRGLGESLFANFRWLPFFLIFFQGLSLSVSYAILAHLFSYNISWSATVKEVESSNFFREVPRIWKRFYPTFIICGVLVGVMIVFSTNLVPRGFVIDGRYWAVIFPLALQVGSHILFPIVLNPWLVIFSY